MNTQYYNIKPKIKIVEKTLTTFSIKIHELVFNEKVSLLVSFYDDVAILENHFVTLEGQEYKNWSNDDNYIINLICQKFNLTLQK
jgi:hypothetical protein